MSDMLDEARVAFARSRRETQNHETDPFVAAAAYAQVAATLAVAEELRGLREDLPGALRAGLLEALGDGSALDKLLRPVQDIGEALAAGRAR
jgi:hypothetical protein